MGIVNKILDVVKETPESIKVTAAIAPPGLSLMGASIEEWSFILACIVSLIIIVEKLPVVVKRITAFIDWMRDVIRKRKA